MFRFFRWFRYEKRGIDCVGIYRVQLMNEELKQCLSSSFGFVHPQSDWILSVRRDLGLFANVLLGTLKPDHHISPVGWVTSRRRPRRLKSIVEGHGGRDAGSAATRQGAGDERHHRQQRHHLRPHHGIHGLDAVKLGGQQRF